jgi:acetolactate synthase-1/2/3 large subunit
LTVAAGAVAVHRVLADAFAAEGVDTVFALMGDGNKMWLTDLESGLGVRVVHCRHEGAALAMADGYSRASSRVGVCAVTYGPGVSQLSTSLLVAAKHGTPLVVFAAGIDGALRDTGAHLDVDDRRLLEAAGAKVWALSDPRSAARVVHRAFYDARTGSRPVAVLAPVDVQESSVENDPNRRTGRLPVTASRPVPADEDLRAAAEVLAASRRPVVVAGRGAVLSGAHGQVVGLADRLGALVATSFGAKGWLDGHPRSLGVAGGFALDGARDLMRQADCVVAVGAALNDHTTDHGRLFPDARIVQVDLRPRPPAIGATTASHYLPGDAAATLTRLERLWAGGLLPEPEAGGKAWSSCRLPPAGHDFRQAQIDANPARIGDGRIDPRLLMMELDRLLPPDCLVVVGGGHFMAFAAQYLSNPGSRRFEMVFDFMTTGQAVPASIGAAAAEKERLVVAVEGDASFLMHVQEIETAARSGISPLIVVVDDGALGAEYHKLRLAGRDPAPAVAVPPDLALVGRALGGAGRRVGELSELHDLMAWYDRSQGPHVVDCLVSRDVVGPL